MERKIQEAYRRTSNYGQEHLLKYFNELSLSEKENLVYQILNIDFEFITSLYENLVKEKRHEKTEDIKPLQACKLEDVSENEKEDYYKIGIEKIKSGKIAALLLAGGQGSRLGHVGPKGAFDIGLPSHKSLFQLQCERLMNISKKCGKYITWYIMTSHINHRDTIQFFEDNDYFGYLKENIVFFKQGMLPTVDSHGKILLSEKGKVSMGPNGNGGCFLALRDEGILKDMKLRGIEWVHLYGVDNALVRVADPYFIGFTVKTELPASSKAVAKKSPSEKAGVFCYRDSRPSVIEYTELPLEMAHKTDIDGNLIYDNANIISHLLKVEFIEEFVNHEIPFHVANKKISYVDNEGEIIRPNVPNGYKFESFIFDILSYSHDMAALKVKREEEFAPVKNKEGVDSPQTARELMFNLHKQWLLSKGITTEELKSKVVVISPLSSYSGENIKKEVVQRKLLESDVVLL